MGSDDRRSDASGVKDNKEEDIKSHRNDIYFPACADLRSISCRRQCSRVAALYHCNVWRNPSAGGLIYDISAQIISGNTAGIGICLNRSFQEHDDEDWRSSDQEGNNSCNPVYSDSSSADMYSIHVIQRQL